VKKLHTRENVEKMCVTAAFLESKKMWNQRQCQAVGASKTSFQSSCSCICGQAACKQSWDPISWNGDNQ